MATLTNALCVDVDDLSSALIEQGLSLSRCEYLVDAETCSLLEHLETLKVKATFFVPGATLCQSPGLVRSLAESGHQVASHGTQHRRVEGFSPEEFREDVSRSRKALEDLIGCAVDTYKAPMWSITAGCVWAYDVLIDAGFRVDHSAMPSLKESLGHAAHRLEPFRYERELFVIPPTTLRIGGRALPFCGGFYCAYVPIGIQSRILQRINDRGMPFNYYFHPFEHSPHGSNRRLLKYRRLYPTLYGVHCGIYRRHLEHLVKGFRFAPLRDAYHHDVDTHHE